VIHREISKGIWLRELTRPVTTAKGAFGVVTGLNICITRKD